ncbi:alpha/beta fold hydrolase [Priestia aryabhattai]|uniref:alpha/beta fold hydrolase n=1 Tax=Priestia aryabhattai TaxID=412384 RepID=UPI0039A35B07
MAHFDSGGNKEVLVLIHGLGSRKESWLPQLPLKEHFRLIAIDLRGHGEDLHNEDITLKRFADDIIRLLLSKGINEAIFLGHSLGGAVVQQIMTDYPHLVKSAILANTTSVFPKFIVSHTVGEIEETLDFVTDEQFIEAVCHRGLYNKDLVGEAVQGFKMRRDTYIQSAKATVGANFLPTIMFFRKPILIIASSHDVVTPSSNAFLTYMFNPFARVKYISKSGHLSNVDNKEEFNKTVLDFLL